MKDFISAVDKHKRLILNAERYIWENPGNRLCRQRKMATWYALLIAY